jgi:hypothetical protein
VGPLISSKQNGESTRRTGEDGIGALLGADSGWSSPGTAVCSHRFLRALESIRENTPDTLLVGPWHVKYGTGLAHPAEALLIVDLMRQLLLAGSS